MFAKLYTKTKWEERLNYCKACCEVSQYESISSGDGEPVMQRTMKVTACWRITRR